MPYAIASALADPRNKTLPDHFQGLPSLTTTLLDSPLTLNHPAHGASKAPGLPYKPTSSFVRLTASSKSGSTALRASRGDILLRTTFCTMVARGCSTPMHVE